MYRYYFVKRWISALNAKAAAFPSLYNFGPIERLNTVGALTDYFVEHHTPFDDANHYYSAYAITQEMLQRTPRTKLIVAAADDPVIPIHDLRAVANASSARLIESRNGGHCAFLRNVRGGFRARRLARSRTRVTCAQRTLLPLGKLDPGLAAPETALDVAAIGPQAQTVEALGYHSLVLEETKDDPFALLALAASATRHVRLGYVGRHRLCAQPLRYRHGGLDAAEDFARPLRAGARLTGSRAHSTPLRRDLAPAWGPGCATTCAPCARSGTAGKRQHR